MKPSQNWKQSSNIGSGLQISDVHYFGWKTQRLGKNKVQNNDDRILNMPKPWGKLCYILFSVLCGICVFIFCEYLIYYPTIFQCSWPNTDHEPSGDSNDVKVLRVIFLSDTHLLGAIRGHWFDKLRREWQMERSFQTALWLLQPEVVFILGDVFDEGKWSSAEDWDDDVRRFQQMFRHPNNTEMIVLVGNHDVGFHYQMDMVKLQRFEKIFNNTSAKMVTRKGVNFLLVNSVAMQGDNCPICRGVESKLRQLSQELNCSLRSVQSGAVEKCNGHQKYPPSLPIILQHYPLYRASDANCTGPDAAPAKERHLLFKEQYDVLSQEASRKLLWWFQPRLILSGHTHSACEVLHERKHPEVSVPSFSWRNRNNPSFMLGVFSPSSFALSKCFLPEESTVFVVYVVTGVVLGLLQVCLLRAGGAGLTLKRKVL